jgi:hypothetical protein
MSDSGDHARARWTGAEGEWVQHRDEQTGEVRNLPPRDLSDQEWDALSAGERKTIRDSGKYEVATEAEAAARRKAPTREATTGAPAAVKE